MSEVYFVVDEPGERQAKYRSMEEAIDAAKEYLKKNLSEHKASVCEVSDNPKRKSIAVFHTGGIFHISEITPVDKKS